MLVKNKIDLCLIAAAAGLIATLSGQQAALAGCPDAGWVTFCNETTVRVDTSQDPNSGPGVFETNPDEKDYAWGDLDQDGDIDLVIVNKQLGTTPGRRRNVLLMNEGGVLVDRTTLYATASSVTLQGAGGSQGFLDLTNDRDVVVVDVNGDGWLDVVTATTLSGGAGGTVGDKAISHPRVYINLQDSPPGSGNWAGLNFDDVSRIPTMPAEPRFCAVSAGDIDNDGDEDLYLGDYQQGGARPVDVNDRLWINDGTGFFTDESAARMTVEMLESSFAMATAIADMNGDGRLDIVKDDALNAPQGVSISYNNNAGAAGFDGFFDQYQIAYANQPYHIVTGDLNNDNMEDLVITDDGLDYYILNQGNDGSGRATFSPRQELIGSVNQFGGNNVIADLDNDGFNDVLVSDMDVDLTSCSTTARIYRNLGNVPNVTIQQEGNVGITSSHLNGVHDIAVFDLNGDARLDLVIGNCTGTRVYINKAPAGCGGPAECSDGLFCNGVEDCVGNVCQPGPGDPCVGLGQLCDEATDACVDCLVDGDCDDGLFCTGTETCVAGACQSGTPPCPAGLVCNDFSDTCDCDDNGDCDDGVFCNGAETCVGGSCQAGSDPCPGQICDEGGGSCLTCLIDADCDDGVFCNGAETCDTGTGTCLPGGGDPCPGQICDEGGDACVDCLVDGDCDDGLYCNGVEACSAGACLPSSGDPCVGAGLTCDEALDTCVGCLTNPDCDDGLFCNGDEACSGGTCVSGSAGVVNGGFVDNSNWTDNLFGDGSITYGGTLTVVGTDAGTGGVNWSSQAGVDVSGANLEFDLISWTPTDAADWDRPIFHIDGTDYGLNADGTIGTVATLANGAFGTIDNTNPVTVPIHFIIDIEALTGAGPHTVGFGVLSVDGQFGAGTAVFDNVTPAGGGATDPCPGQLCDEAADLCVDCLVDGDCDNGVFCDGTEICVAGSCKAGSPIDCNDGVGCTTDSCNEGTNSCDNVPSDAACDDGLFCNGPEICDAIDDCQSGGNPCAGNEICNEASDQCDAIPLAVQPKMGAPLAGLTQNELDRFFAGKVEFDRVFSAADGLGPVFNQNSCSSCHNNPIGGSGGITVTRFGILDAGTGDFDDLAQFGGSLLQSQAISIDCAEEVPVIPGVDTAIRSTPSILGFGLLEAIPDADIQANASTGPGVTGRVHMVPAFEDPMGSPLRVGRFGWKAQVATVLTFSADAGLNEMGITNRFLVAENDPNGINPPSLGAPDNCDTVADPEDNAPVGSAFIDLITDFQRFTAAPPQTPRSGMSGEAIFTNIGCAVCHIPSYVTGAAPESAIANKIVKPYSDFLLHDMGLLFDGIVQGDAEAGEIRTPALWGLRVRDPMLHDASETGGTFNQRVVAAIRTHGQTGSEAKPSVDLFQALSPADQAAVVAFLDSLGRAEFDANGDNEILLDDFIAFSACFTGPGSFYTADDPCAISDIDQDGDVDLEDFNFFLVCYTGPLQDCNANTQSDLLDILLGTSLDTNQDGIPDECTQSCIDADDCGDLDVCTFDACTGNTCSQTSGLYGDIATLFGCGQDGAVNLFDVTAILDAFGNTGACLVSQADIASSLGICAPDGVLNIWDIVNALDAFSGIDACCSGPAPTPPSGAVSEDRQDIRILMSANRRIVKPGTTVVVDVYAANVKDLRGYELSLDVEDGPDREVVVLNATLDNNRIGFALAAVDHVVAEDPGQHRVVAAATDGTVSSNTEVYLGSFTLSVVNPRSSRLSISLAKSSILLLGDGSIATTQVQELVLDVSSKKPLSTSFQSINKEQGLRMEGQ